MNDLIEIDYFYIIDIAWAILALVIIMMIVNVRKKIYREYDYAEYYTINVWMKIGLSLVYAFYYINIVKGGDTLAYWDGAIKLNKLFWKNPGFYFEEMLNEPNLTMMYKHFDTEMGIPPGWIYRETNSWFVSKLMSIISFISFKSYLVGTLIMAYISSLASWKLFQLLYDYGLHTKKKIAVAIILIPSVSFWCSGVSKDTIVLFSTIFIIYHGLTILSLEKQTKLINWVAVIFFTFILEHTRSFMITTIYLPLVFSYSVRLVKKYRENKFAFYFIRLISITLGVLFFVYQGDQLSQSEELEQAALLNKDFSNNATYDGTRYDIGITEYTAQGMIQVMPAAILAGIYRPFPWEAKSITMIANGIEDAYFIYLTFVFFFKGNIARKIDQIRKNEFLVFSFFFMILMAYMAGVTSGLLGVLVRFKAPVIPFFLLLLTLLPKSENLKQ